MQQTPHNPSGDPETWIQRTLREAVRRREELTESIADVLAELRQVNAVIEATGGEPEPVPESAARLAVAPEPSPQTPSSPPAQAPPSDPESAVEPEPEPQVPEPTPEPEPEPEPEPPEPTPPAPTGNLTPRQIAARERDDKVIACIAQNGGEMRFTDAIRFVNIPPGSRASVKDRMVAEGRIELRKEERTGSYSASEIATLTAKEKARLDPDGGFDDGPGGQQTHSAPPAPPAPESREATVAELDNVFIVGEQLSTKKLWERLHAEDSSIGGVKKALEKLPNVKRLQERDNLGFPVYERTARRSAGDDSGRTLQHPGPEALPAELRGMPAAKLNMPVTARINTARVQLAVYEAMKARGTTVVTEEIHDEVIKADPSLTRGRVKDALDKLTEAGLIELTGRFRFSAAQQTKVQNRGRTQKEFRLSRTGSESLRRTGEGGGSATVPVGEDEGSPSPVAPKPEATITPAKGVRSTDEPKLEWVRDVVVKQEDGKAFSAGTIASPREWDVAITATRLQQLADLKKITLTIDMPDMKMYTYTKPTDAGTAAKLDMASRPSGGSGGGGGYSSGGAVEGTGRPTLPSDPEARKLVQDVRKLGYRCEPNGSGHWEVSGKDIRRVLIAGTPSRSGKSILNARTRLRRAGVGV